jgi:hypothetical protein
MAPSEKGRLMPAVPFHRSGLSHIGDHLGLLVNTNCSAVVNQQILTQYFLSE